MEFIEPGFHRKKYLYLWSARNVLGDILSVSKPGDVKQLDARIQKPAVFNKRWWRLEEIREEGNDPGELRGAVSSARVGLPTPEGSLPRGASEGINHGGWLRFTGSQGGKKASPGSKWEVAPCLKVSLSSDGCPFSLLVGVQKTYTGGRGRGSAWVQTASNPTTKLSTGQCCPTMGPRRNLWQHHPHHVREPQPCLAHTLGRVATQFISTNLLLYRPVKIEISEMKRELPESF